MRDQAYWGFAAREIFLWLVMVATASSTSTSSPSTTRRSAWGRGGGWEGVRRGGGDSGDLHSRETWSASGSALHVITQGGRDIRYGPRPMSPMQLSSLGTCLSGTCAAPLERWNCISAAAHSCQRIGAPATSTVAIRTTIHRWTPSMPRPRCPLTLRSGLA